MRSSSFVLGFFGSFALGVLGTATASADTPAKPDEAAPKDPFAGIKFQEGPVDGKLENVATIKVPEGVTIISGRADSEKFIEATHNLVSHEEVGILLSSVKGENWWLSFEFDPVGFVKDDEKESLDADKLLESMREGTEKSNEERRKRGWDELHLLGWHTPPRYNPATQNLEWATRLQGKTGEDVNYNVRLLGRRGVMSVTLVCDPTKLDAAVAKMQGLLGGFAYVADQAYASYKPGDKLAAYGLTALVAGGTIAIAAKTGLLAKFWKIIVAGVAAAAAGLRKLFGGKKKPDEPTV